ncbi:MAG: ribosome maturation factor RimP [Nannocystaceae bacterium]|nr:ribosome maturation factor RimP [bacterium]
MSPSSDQTHDDARREAPCTDAPASAKVVRPEALLEDVLGPVVESMGYELVHTEFTGSGKHRRLCVFLDRPAAPDSAEGGGISLDDCSKMSPIISSTLDAAEADPDAAAVARVLKAPYVLEVSSPGLDRPLAKLSHFRRYLGGLARVTTFAPLDAGSKQKNFNGRIEAVQPAPHAPEDDRSGTVTLLDPDAKTDSNGAGGRHVISLDQIRRANLVYEG